MSGLTIAAPGADQLASTLGHAAEELEDLEQANARAGELVRSSARIPRRTGALANTVRVDTTPNGFTILAGGNGVDYAVPVHQKNPFLTTALTTTEDKVADLYLDHTATALDQIGT
jgi:hypothetical protein